MHIKKLSSGQDKKKDSLTTDASVMFGTEENDATLLTAQVLEVVLIVPRRAW